jgi:pimeloyl-ACP methyl ester carboxylesterase
MELFDVAERELAQLLKDFPERREEGEKTLQLVRNLVARLVLNEIRVRRSAGQHRLAYTMLKKFPAKGVAQETLLEVEEFLTNKDFGKPLGYDVVLKQREDLLKQLDGHMKELASRDTKIAEQLEAIRKEIMAEFSVHVLDRLVPYRELSTDPSATLEQKVALAISGWTQGPKGATNNLPIALSLYKVRDLVHAYINAELKLDRTDILDKVKAQEGATAERLAALLAHMKPPKATPEAQSGLHELTVDGLVGAGPISYTVQLPPEYNPYRRYPAIVTLNGGSTTPKMQLDWWAGGADAKGNRNGHGSRHGYIVIAPTWTAPLQGRYEYSLREHVAVLNSLRDACRRFSIDTDRVFLTGHAMGGTAAWDIGLAHPDLFAGVIPIACRIDKYCNLYWENARRLPLYYVVGEMDGGNLTASAMTLDRDYMPKNFPVIVAEFVGRGHEDFMDEQIRLFEWMGLQRRDFARKEFECVTMRPWDNFFWWLEMEDMPASRMVLPEDWAKSPKGVFRIKGKVLNNNSLVVSGGASKVTIHLLPELVNFGAPLRLTVTSNAKTYAPSAIKPSVSVMLEDVRTRGDRQHPFWASLIVKDLTREVIVGAADERQAPPAPAGRATPPGRRVRAQR